MAGERLHGELVATDTPDGVRLHGMWLAPVAEQAGNSSVDTVIMMHGVGGSFYTTRIFNLAAPKLQSAGVGVLLANNRGHDLITRSGGSAPLVGAAYEKVADSKKDVAALLDQAVELGARNIMLWGHSLGAVKAILYAAEENDPRVRMVAASSPPRFAYSKFRASDEWEKLEPSFDRANQLVADGQPRQLMEVLRPAPMTIAADTYLDKYGPHESFDYVKLIPNVEIPLLVTAGSKELAPLSEGGIGVPFENFEANLRNLQERMETLGVCVIEGADHPYTGREDTLYDAILAWMAGSVSKETRIEVDA